MSYELTPEEIESINKPVWSIVQVHQAFDYLSEICNHNSKVYFIGNATERKLKIGFSDDPFARRDQLQTGCPFNLSIYGTIPGDKFTESKLHERFRYLRQSGEWFYLSDDLWEFVMLAATYGYAQLPYSRVRSPKPVVSKPIPSRKYEYSDEY